MMKCPKCGFDVPEGKNFCVECGKKIEIICPNCQSVNSPGYKFCGDCGNKFDSSSDTPSKELSFDDKLQKIQRYLPEGITDKILSQRGKIEGERKQVTVMFCDMEGFTSIVEMLGADEAYSIMDQVYEILIHKVHDFEGTVNEMTGDGIMALFGAPIALEDAPQRAIRAAMAIHREMSRFSDKIKQEKIPPIKMRIGIHTGPVVVGSLGNDLRVEFKAVGDTVNLASRIEGLAEPGATYISEDTFKRTEGLFRVEALGEKDIRGKKDPVNIYRVITTSSRRTRFDVSAERGLTLFVGRERELELMLESFERVKTGRGQAFSIMSEAGVGKSRLLYEFRKKVSNEDVIFREGKCLSYSTGVPYPPIVDVLKSNFDIKEGDSDDSIIEKVRSNLDILHVDQEATLPYLLEILSVKNTGIDVFSISPEGGKKDRIIEAVKQFALKASELRPLIIAVEDLHWIDQNSEACLKRLFMNISGARILLIFTYRTEYLPTWGARSYHNQVTLNRLSNQESLSVASHLLKTDEIDNDLEELILEKTEGVPFFIEEFIKSLKELQIIKETRKRYHLAKDIQDLIIPSTIHDVIMARVDALPDEAKALLQAGSVVEREFSYRMIKRMANIPEQELLSHLSAIKDSELIYERGVYPESTHVFKHALTREVVYDSIIAGRKKRLHERVGKAIEALHQENIYDQYETLAEHFIRSGNHEKGAEYSRLAKRKSEKSAFLKEAIFHIKRRIDFLEKLPETEDIQIEIIDDRTTLGLYYIQLQDRIRSKEAIDPVIDLALKKSHIKGLSRIYGILGQYACVVKENYPEAAEYLEDAVTIAEQDNDIISLVIAHSEMGVLLWLNCEFERAFKHLNHALEINVTANSSWGISLYKSYISAQVYFSQGKIDLAFQTSSDALKIAEANKDVFSQTWACTSHGLSCFAKGYFSEAAKFLQRAIKLSEQTSIGFSGSIAHLYLGQISCQNGEYTAAKNYFSKAVQELSGILPSLLILIKLHLAKASVLKNEKDIDLAPLYDDAQKNRAKYLSGGVQSVMGEILLQISDKYLPEAGEWIQKAIQTNEENGMMFALGGSYSLYADFFKQAGDNIKARENLNKAIDIYKECGSDGWVEMTEKKLAELE